MTLLAGSLPRSTLPRFFLLVYRRGLNRSRFRLFSSHTCATDGVDDSNRTNPAFFLQRIAEYTETPSQATISGSVSPSPFIHKKPWHFVSIAGRQVQCEQPNHGAGFMRFREKVVGAVHAAITRRNAKTGSRVLFRLTGLDGPQNRAGSNSRRRHRGSCCFCARDRRNR
jgi:hypothetical protein